MQSLDHWLLFPDRKAKKRETMQALTFCGAQLFTVTFWSVRLEITLTQPARVNIIECCGHTMESCASMHYVLSSLILDFLLFLRS